MARKEHNYIFATFWFSLTTLVILLGMWFMPVFYVGELKSKKVNMISEIASDSLLNAFFVSPTDDQMIAQKPLDKFNEIIKSLYLAQNHYIDSISNQADSIYESQNMDDFIGDYALEYNAENLDAEFEIIPIATENRYDIPQIENINEPQFEAFLSKLKTGQRVRIAVAGDSFTEGDIFTQDIREQLQKIYGGAGVGFVPITSQTADFRKSVVHKFNGWTTKSVLNASGDYHLSGYLFVPSEGAWVHYQGTSYRENLSSFSDAKLLFVNKGKTIVTAIVNDTTKIVFNPNSGDHLQSISVTQNISTIKFIVNNVAGFTAYGAFLDGENGVSVDSYSIRSYSGAGLADMSAEIAQQWQDIIPYDLIILQYGLNVANDGVTRYSQYGKRLYEVVNNLKKIMPNTAILIMSVSDRQNRADQTTLPAIYALERTQRAVAYECDVAFWSTLYAMQNAGGVGAFVKKGWAAKDYTHLSAQGGRVVAKIFVNALHSRKNANR